MSLSVQGFAGACAALAVQAGSVQSHQSIQENAPGVERAAAFDERCGACVELQTFSRLVISQGSGQLCRLCHESTIA